MTTLSGELPHADRPSPPAGRKAAAGETGAAAAEQALTATRLQPIERLRWSWRPSRYLLAGGLSSMAGNSLAYGIMLGMFTTVAAAVVDPDLIRHMWFGIIVTLLLLLFDLSGEYWQPSLAEHRPRPNEGIRRSARFAMLHGGGIFLLVVAVLGASTLTGTGLDDRAVWLLAGLLGVVLAIVRGARFGGAACLHQWLVRYSLRSDGGPPLRFLRFLHDAEQRVLIRRAGNGFAFPHRLLQQHLSTPAETLLARLDAIRLDGTD